MRNRITYTYTYADNQYRINKISYANTSVEFGYAPRPDALFSYMVHKKNPSPWLVKGFYKNRRLPTLPLYAVPSAQPGLTSLFGMGRGGAPAL